MAVTVKFFASLREQLQQSEVKLELTVPTTVSALWRQICGDLPLPINILMAVNLSYVTAETVVKDGDEVAFFPPVTGG
ncbi:molybdopterin converting factor subunit 1 [Thioflexithrix psekupsensis]|uniref:Molybdopterin synthase sulfur carrier subunit n=1 Tax=Thioflexithrix psekupsensis TaxID=1570016 RepID=A0A251X3X8_9GAMM|nr:molybdopterin converting factor subunit 1 [Thioflexithrix psekupsensis]OUD12203.1 molybdopterin converting factor subunit 1 [Thioflexithrix psekupsensis]